MKQFKILVLSLLLTHLFSLNTLADCNPNTITNAPTSRYVIHGDGTVTDTQTDLMWAQCRQGTSGTDCATVSVIQFTWSDALALRRATSDMLNRSDWRLPNVKELESLIERACFSPAVNEEVFPNTGTIFWSSTPSALNPEEAMIITNTLGGVSRFSRSSDVVNVRLVRGGQ